jgi:hypothetical protein
MAYADARDRRDKREILKEGESAVGTIVAIEAENGKYPAWRVTVEFQAINQTEPTRIQFQIRTRPRPQSWGDWSAFWGAPSQLDDIEVGRPISLHYPKQWPGLAVLDARPYAIRVG